MDSFLQLSCKGPTCPDILQTVKTKVFFFLKLMEHLEKKRSFSNQNMLVVA